MSLIVFFNRLEGFVAQVVLDFARVVERRLLADPKAHEQLAENGVALIDMGRNAFAFLGQVDMVILIDVDQPVFAHLAQNDGNRRAGIGKIGADVDGVNLVLLASDTAIIKSPPSVSRAPTLRAANLAARDAQARLHWLHYNIFR